MLWLLASGGMFVCVCISAVFNGVGSMTFTVWCTEPEDLHHHIAVFAVNKHGAQRERESDRVREGSSMNSP